MSKDTKISPQDLAKEILQINKEIESLVKQGEERLAKGMPLRKDGDELPPPPGGPEGAPAPGAPAPGGELEGQEPEGQEGGEPEGQEGQEPGPEGAPQGQDDRAAVEAQVKEMSDDEINTALEVLMAEKEARESAQGDQGAPAPAAPGAPAPGGEPELAQKSMDSAMDKMAKSMEAMTKTVEKLTGQVATLSKPAPAPKPTVATKPAAMNAVEVLHKSGKPAEQRLNKAGTMNFVLSEQKLRKSRHVLNTDLVSRLNRVQTDSELHELQDYMTAKGIVLPKL